MSCGRGVRPSGSQSEPPYGELAAMASYHGALNALDETFGYPTTCVLPFGDARLLCAVHSHHSITQRHSSSRVRVRAKTAAIRVDHERSDCPKQVWLAQNEAHTMLLSTALARARDVDQIMLKLGANECTRA